MMCLKHMASTELKGCGGTSTQLHKELHDVIVAESPSSCSKVVWACVRNVLILILPFIHYVISVCRTDFWM